MRFSCFTAYCSALVVDFKTRIEILKTYVYGSIVSESEVHDLIRYLCNIQQHVCSV